jgi:chemotaxis protein methyltransferase CheR
VLLEARSSYRIMPEYREKVVFQYHNLVTTPFPSALHNLCDVDIIFCRNVMIYFSQDRVRKLISGFRDTLEELMGGDEEGKIPAKYGKGMIHE